MRSKNPTDQSIASRIVGGVIEGLEAELTMDNLTAVQQAAGKLALANRAPYLGNVVNQALLMRASGECE
jgi:hypothetical protein